MKFLDRMGDHFFGPVTNPWLEEGRAWGWKGEDMHYECLADMVRRIKELEKKVIDGDS